MDQPTSALCFVLHYRGERIRMARFTTGSVTLGSSPAAMLQVPDGEGLQAVVNQHSGTWMLLDLGAGTTLLNGAPIVSAPLRDGDIIGFGAVQVHFHAEAEAEQTEPIIHPAPSDDAVTEDPLAFWMRTRANPLQLGDDPKGAPMLEVAAVWGDVIQDVRHFPRKDCTVTIGELTGNRWRVSGMPVAWIPTAISWLGWLAAPGLSEVRQEMRCDFFSQDLQQHTLLRTAYGQLELCFKADWDGFVEVDAVRHSLAALIAAGETTRDGEDHVLALQPGSHVVVDTGSMIFVSREVQASRRVVAPIQDRIDYPFVGVMSFMGFAFVMMSVLMMNAPRPANAEVIQLPDRFAEVFIQQVQEPEPVAAAEDVTEHSEEEGDAPPEEEGTAGVPDATQPTARGQSGGPERSDEEIVADSGLLGAMNSGGMDAVFGTSNLNASLTGGIGGVTGNVGRQLGTRGHGSRGPGIGGGGTLGTIDGVGTRGRGNGEDTYGVVDSGPRAEGTISLPSEPVLLGSLDKHLVDQVVKNHMNQIRYCYQRELNRDPGLGGKVVVKFVIAGDGSVSRASIKSSTMGSAAVESCITNRFMQLTFPAPQGNGIVIVSYPFLFAPG